jgi:hypothetical protein
MGVLLANLAILIGNTQYQTLSTLDCCADDVCAIRELLESTGKFDRVETLVNKDASELKDRIRAIIGVCEPLGECFVYFTGHGYQHKTDFFFCAPNFDAKRPHETGLSNTELHTLLRSAEAELIVKVIDACNSGTLLIKSDGAFLPTSKNGFKNLIQIASCLDSQTSLTGEPLSLFTEKLRAAALRKLEGPVYYADIINTLRDEFLENNEQTPHFVLQGTGREEFVEDGKRLDGLRAKLSATSSNAAPVGDVPSVVEEPLSILSILQEAEAKFAKKEIAEAFINHLFEKLTKATTAGSVFQDLFDTKVIEHSDFFESTARAFIIRILSSEKRPDNFVTITIPRELRRRDPFNLTRLFDHPDDVVSDYQLTLNCKLQKVQLTITLTPRFAALKRFVLVVSCAPSLEICYVMEMLTQHPLRDWGVFDYEGTEVARRWYKMQWTDPCDSLVDKIYNNLRSVVQGSVDAAAQVLSLT